MDDTERKDIACAIRRCRGQYARPPGLSRYIEQWAINGGYLRFNEWPSGHYEVTEKGRELLADLGN